MRAVIAAFAMLVATIGYAEQSPIAMPNDSKIVNFAYDKANTYAVLTRPGSVTDIVLNDDEQFVVLALGDTVQWVTSKAPGHVFIRPSLPNLITTGSLVTSKRTYQLTFRSSEPDGKFYQQITWSYPELIALQEARTQQAVVDAQVRAETARRAYDDTVISTSVDMDKLNFDYDIKGDATFKPTQVFDDGKFTWVRMPKSQEMPAFFMVEGKEKELINTHLKGDYVVVQRIVPSLLLKLGDREVKVINRSIVKRSLFGFGE